MAVSGNVKFDPALDDVIEEAFERCGVNSRSGYDLFTVRRSLIYYFLNGVIVDYFNGK